MLIHWILITLVSNIEKCTCWNSPLFFWILPWTGTSCEPEGSVAAWIRDPCVQSRMGCAVRGPGWGCAPAPEVRMSLARWCPKAPPWSPDGAGVPPRRSCCAGPPLPKNWPLPPPNLLLTVIFLCELFLPYHGPDHSLPLLPLDVFFLRGYWSWFCCCEIAVSATSG